MEALLEQIKVFADQAHGEQMRRYTADRYIVHPVRVMEICKGHTSATPVLAAALLHDVLEDTPVTKQHILAFLSGLIRNEEAVKTVQLVEELTDVYIKSSYPGWNRRKRRNKEAERLAATSPEAQTVKYADIIDNAPEITRYDPEFARRFLFEYRNLIRKMQQGIPELRQRATDSVHQCMVELGLRH